jgi:hypothetical protein
MFGKLYLLPKVSNTPPNPPWKGGENNLLKPPFIRGVGGVMSEFNMLYNPFQTFSKHENRRSASKC